MKQVRKTLGAIAVTGLLIVLVVPTAFAQTPPTKMAVINVVQLLEESDLGKKGIDELKALQKVKSEERAALRTEAKDLETKMTEGQFSLAEEKLAELQKQLEDKAIELQRFNDDATRELQKSQEKMLTDIQELVMPIINQVGREQGYTMIFNKFESGLVYAHEAIDITQEVMDLLNNSAPTDEVSVDTSESGS